MQERGVWHKIYCAALLRVRRDSRQPTFLRNGSACYGLSPGLKKCPVAVPDQIIGLTLFLDLIDRCHSLTSLLLPPAALGSLPPGHFFVQPAAVPASSSPSVYKNMGKAEAFPIFLGIDALIDTIEPPWKQFAPPLGTYLHPPKPGFAPP